MLQKFLFVGVGGSGGKTLRFLYENLRMRLAEAGHTGDIPAAWQFLHVDVPVTPDGASPDLPPQLPPGSYVGLAPRNISYQALDNLLQLKGRDLLEHVAPWRPDPALVSVPPKFGAGQYRAVGRVIAGVSLRSVVERLQQCARELTHVAVDRELSQVAGRLTGQPGVAPYPPQVIVVTSIAGGAGAGAFLDVCDAIRHVLPASSDQIAALLYTPDVFNDLPPANRAGINANALASIGEILACYWNNENPDATEFAFLQQAGVSVQQVGSRGPSMSLLVGRSNGNIAFTSQLDVYRATARALTAWTADRFVQDMVHTSVIGNWMSKAQRVVDRTRLAPGRPAPFSALGYASVGLGRNRFATYAAERLARHAVDRLLRGHLVEAANGETPEAARDRQASNLVDGYLQQAGLRQTIQEDSEVVGAVRGGGLQVRSERFRSLRSEIVRATTQNMASLTVKQARTRIMNELTARWNAEMTWHEQEHQRHAREWCNHIQRRVIDVAADHLARVGAPVTGRLLHMAIGQILDTMVPGLEATANRQHHIISGTQQRVHSAFVDYDGEIRPDNPAIGTAVEAGIESIEAQAEQHLHDLAARLLGDLARNVLTPLHDAVMHAQERLATADVADGPVQMWSTDVPPRKLRPAENELLLDNVDGYPDHYERLVQSTTGQASIDGAVRAAVLQLVSGVHDHGARQVAILTSSDWTPTRATLPGLDTPSRARFELTIDADDLITRARKWSIRPNTTIGDYVHESLADYLDEDSTSPEEHADRLDRFQAALQQAVSTAQPLVHINAGAYAHFHGPVSSPNDLYLPVISKLPFPAGHPARDRVAHVFHWKSGPELDAMFDDSASQQIELTMFLDAPAQPPVFASLTEPIAGDWSAHRTQPGIGGFWQWRRTRPLPAAVPVAPIVRRRMIRGWFVARLLNLVSVEDPLREPVTIINDDGDVLEFPFPLLGPRVRSMTDVLPAVLESLVITLVVQPQTSMLPYHRLEQLGNSVGAPPGTTLAVELHRWITEGWTVPGASHPDPTLAGKAADERATRADALLETLDRYINHYRKLDFDATGDEAPPRSWEIRDDIVQQLTVLRNEIEQAREDTDFSVGIG